MRPRTLFACVCIALVASTIAPVSAEIPLDDVCRNVDASETACRGLDQLVRIPGVLCREFTGNETACSVIDGRVLSERMVAAHERSWITKALALQRGLDDEMPLHDEQWTHTHNSFNADAYQQSVGGLDPNQSYSIRDQLRMGIRVIEIDLWWVNNALVACHGQSIPIGPVRFPLGCLVNDPLASTMFTEIRDWMDEHPGEIVLLYLENNLQDVPAAHAAAATQVREAFGGLIYETGKPCASLPMDTSRASIRRSGKRILITGNCGPGAWGGIVHDRGPRWDESGIGNEDDFPAYPCTAERAEHKYGPNLIRRYADETGLTAATLGGGDVTVADARNMVRCGVGMVGLDNLVPFDERMIAWIWSWAPEEPSTSQTGACAFHGRDGRFYSDSCTKSRPFVCSSGTTWAVTDQRGPWSAGAGACEELGKTFDVPRDGFKNEKVKAAKPNGAWLNYHATAGRWVSG